jgi:hypothetical protein
MRFLALLSALLFSASAFAASQEEQWIADRLKHAEPMGKQVVLSKLRDPDSAVFRNVHPTPNGVTLCGEVNAKNGYGGYTGFKKFYTIWQLGVVWMEGQGTYLESSYQEKCEVPLEPPSQDK